jgi:hypothetical protein
VAKKVEDKAGTGPMGRPQEGGTTTAPSEGLEKYRSLPQSFNDAMAGAVDSSEVTGQSELVEQDTLIGVPFVIWDWKFQQGDFNREYINVQVITADNRRLCFNDGGVGIGPTLQETEVGTKIVCKKGLRRSDYETVVNGEKIKAHTFYLS